MTDAKHRPPHMMKSRSLLVGDASSQDGVALDDSPKINRDRAISWDLLSISSPREEEFLAWRSNSMEPPLSPMTVEGGPVNASLRWNQLKEKVLSHEDEAETYIQRALEESDPTLSGPSEAQTSLFPGVSHNSMFIQDEARGGKGSHTGEHLWKMAFEMQQLQTGTGEKLDKNNKAGNNATSSADRFAQHAATLMQRSRHQHVPSLETVPELQSTPFSPVHQWKTLRRTVQIANALHAKDDDADDAELGGNAPPPPPSTPGGNSQRNAPRPLTAHDHLKSEFRDFEAWLVHRQVGARKYLCFVLCWIIVPCTFTAAILFYGVGNPPCGSQAECIEHQQVANARTDQNTTSSSVTDSALQSLFSQDDRFNVPSVSWWLLFLGVRQVITYSLARATQAWIIDFCALRTRWFGWIVGPFASLFCVQAKGWPFILFWWGVYDFALLYGDSQFARHWMFWQSAIAMFGEDNPSGDIPSSGEYRKLLVLAVMIALAVAVKRFWVGLFLGQQTFDRYSQDLRKIMERALLIGHVATLTRRMEKHNYQIGDEVIEHTESYDRAIHAGNDNADITAGSTRMFRPASKDEAGEHSHNSETIVLNVSIREQIDELLGRWEEPQSIRQRQLNHSIQTFLILSQYSISLLCRIRTAHSRETCVASAESLYFRLVDRCSGSRVLKFDAIAIAAMQPDGSLNEGKLADLVRLFRPNRDGNLSLVDFVRSVDSVYKDLRRLRASVANSSRLDNAFEKLINIAFTLLLACVGLNVIGVDPRAIFISVSGFVLAFAFMIKTAASNYFEGLLLILVRRPFDIGDRVNAQSVNGESNFKGSSGWVVKDINLFHTTIVFGSTSEVATVSNGALAESRIINHARSPEAVLWFLMKFPIETPFEKFAVLRKAIERFMQNRPREWLSFAAFRSANVDVERGFIEYIVCGIHRESWQSIKVLKTSFGELKSFSVELSKKLKMQYRLPSRPVDLKIQQRFPMKAQTAVAEYRPQQDPFSQASFSGLDSVEKMFEVRNF